MRVHTSSMSVFIHPYTHTRRKTSGGEGEGGGKEGREREEGNIRDNMLENICME